MLSRLFIAALWSPSGKGLTSWLSFAMLYCVFVTFPCGILGQVLYLIVSIPDHCHLSYLYTNPFLNKNTKLSSHEAPTPINDNSLIKHNMLIHAGDGAAKFLQGTTSAIINIYRKTFLLNHL